MTTVAVDATQQILTGLSLNALPAAASMAPATMPAKAKRTKRHYDPGATSDWYTPGEYIEAARATMGAIDLDPASCALANMTVRAAAYFDRAADGLRQQWHGRVWLNPPYSDYMGQAAEWAARLLAEHQSGRVQQGVLLVNLSTSYQKAMQEVARAGLVCMVNRRIRFLSAAGSEERRPTQANVIFYLGERRQAFAEHFGRYGVVLGAMR